MHITILPRWIASAFVFSVCVGCGGGGGGESGAVAESPADEPAAGSSAPVSNLTGTWRVTESGVSNCPELATFANGPADITITQNGNDLTVEAAAGTFAGTINGNRAGWTGSYPSGNGNVTITTMDLTVSDNGNALSGAANWMFSGPGLTCNGTSQSINATRVLGNGAPPQAPSALSGAPQSPSSISLVWNDNSDNETGFKIERRLSGGGGASFAQIAEVPAGATTRTDTGLNALTAYDYRVRATNANGDSAYSNVFTVTTLAAPTPAPQPPANLAATAESTGSIRLQWNDNSADETSFRIERSTSANTGFSEIASVSSDTTSFTDSGLASATQYFYRVRARNGAGNSAYSNTANATTLTAAVAPDAPSNLNATPVSSSRIELVWRDRSDNETAFKIERSLSRDEGFSQIGTTAAGVTSFSDTGLEARTRYFYRVRATNANGDSDYSNTEDARTFLDILPDDDDDDDDD